MKPLLHGDGNELERALAQSALDDGPGDHRGRANTIRALAAAGVVSAGALSTTSAGAAAGVPSLVGKAVASGWGKALLAASASVVGVWVAVANFGLLQPTEQAAQPDAASTERVIEPALALPIVEAVQSVPAQEQSTLRGGEDATEASKPALSETKSVETPSAGSGSTPAKKVSASNEKLVEVTQDSLAQERQLLARAHGQVGRGDHAGARQTLAEYSRRFPGGILASEASVVRVKLLLGEGNRSEAEQLARRYVAANPNTPFARRLRKLVFNAPE